MAPLRAQTLSAIQQTFIHGQNIFVYTNIRTNQVIYSLTRTLDNHLSLKQLPFLGKKTVPSHIRKDLWYPFCLITFPRPLSGLIAFRKLREFKRLHETTYPLSLITDPDTGARLPTKERGKVLMDQKANSVADIAAVLLQQDREPTAEEKQKAERKRRNVRRLMKKGRSTAELVTEEWRGTDGVMVRWANILDAEFAETWPEKVVHDRLGKNRYTVAWPSRDAGESIEDDGQEEKEVGGSVGEGRVGEDITVSPAVLDTPKATVTA